MRGCAGLYHRQRLPFGVDEPTASLTKIVLNMNRMIGRRNDALFFPEDVRRSAELLQESQH